MLYHGWNCFLTPASQQTGTFPCTVMYMWQIMAFSKPLPLYCVLHWFPFLQNILFVWAYRQRTCFNFFHRSTDFSNSHLCLKSAQTAIGWQNIQHEAFGPAIPLVDYTFVVYNTFTTFYLPLTVDTLTARKMCAHANPGVYTCMLVKRISNLSP